MYVSMYVCMCMNVLVCWCMYVCAFAPVRVRVCEVCTRPKYVQFVFVMRHVCDIMCMYEYMQTCMFIYIVYRQPFAALCKRLCSVCMYACMQCACMHVSMCACMHVCMHI